MQGHGDAWQDAGTPEENDAPRIASEPGARLGDHPASERWQLLHELHERGRLLAERQLRRTRDGNTSTMRDAFLDDAGERGPLGAEAAPITLGQAEAIVHAVRELQEAQLRTERKVHRVLRGQCGILGFGLLVILAVGVQLARVSLNIYKSGVQVGDPATRLKSEIMAVVNRQEVVPSMAKGGRGAAHSPSPIGFLKDYRKFFWRISQSTRMLKTLPQILALRAKMLLAAKLSEEGDETGELHALGELGEILTSLFLNLRGVWPKVAQIVSMRPDVIRWDPVREGLARSHDDCAPKTDEEVQEILAAQSPHWKQQSQLGPRLGVGSIGQVHLLLPREGKTFPDGEDAVVAKIAFHAERWKMKEDFRVMEAIGSNTGSDEASVLLRSIWLFVQDSMEQIEGEFDMMREASFTTAGKEMVEHGQEEVRACVSYAFGVKQSRVPILAVPGVLDGSSDAVLIMQKASGTPLLQYLNSLSGSEREAAQVNTFGTIFMWIGYMIFSKGFYHGDPHPGQFLFDASANRLWLLDWGLSQKLTDEQRFDLHELFYLMHYAYEADTLRPRILRVAPAVLRYMAGRLALERFLHWAVADMDAHLRHRIANVMRRMGFASRRDSDLTLTAAAFGLFDTNAAFNDVEVLNKWQSYDAILEIPGKYLVITRMVQTIAGYARKLKDAQSVIKSRSGARWHFSELSNVRLWRQFVQEPPR